MALFCAPAWMMKGGGGSPASFLSWSDNDPYRNREKVRCVLKNLKLDMTKNGTLSFDCSQVGFTKNTTVSIYLEMDIHGWKYADMHQTVTLQAGKSYSITLGSTINRNATVKEYLTNGKKTYLLLCNSEEVIYDQVRVEIVK